MLHKARNVCIAKEYIKRWRFSSCSIISSIRMNKLSVELCIHSVKRSRGFVVRFLENMFLLRHPCSPSLRMTQQKAVKLLLSSSNLNLIHSFERISHSHAHSIHNLTADPERTVRSTHLLCMFTNKFNLFPIHKPNIYSCSDTGPEWWESIQQFLLVLGFFSFSHTPIRVCTESV